MKKFLIAAIAVLVLIVATVVAVPFFIDWNRFKPDIAAAVRDATGRELTIDGDIEISLGTTVGFAVSDIRLSNAPGMATPDMMMIGAVRGQFALWPLLSREVVIDSFVVVEPSLFLEVDAEGRPNWTFEPAPTAEAKGEAPGDARGVPLNDLRLGDIRIEKGLVSYIDTSRGQAIQARDINVLVALAGIESALTIDGRLSLNDEPVTVKVTLDSPGKLLAGERFTVATALRTKQLSFDLNGGVLQSPVPGFDGDMALAIGSVGELAAWLGQPLSTDQPDPGSLRVTARLTADGAKVVLEEARIKGKGLDAKVTGSVDASGATTKVALNVESGVLDVDKYLPPRDRGAARVPAQAPRPGRGGPANPLDALPGEPIDLAVLRQTEADVRIDIAGIRAMGFAVGKIAFGATLKGGVLDAKLDRLSLYGGDVKGQVRLDGSQDALAVSVDLAITKVKMDQLSRAATGEAAIAGVASGMVKASARGASPRALAQALRGQVTLRLRGVDVKKAPVGSLSALDVAVSLPDVETSPSVKGFAIYNKQRVDFDVVVDPLAKVLTEDRFALAAAIKSKRINLAYKGLVQQRPLPGLDGDFDLDIPSVGKLAAWLGQPLAASQPDPGPLRVMASFAADGGKVVLKQAKIEGKTFGADASGSFDGSGEIAKLVLKLKAGVLDLDQYLPPPAKAEAAEAARAVRPAAGGDPLAAISDDPIDLNALKKTDADVSLEIGGLKVRGVEIGRVVFGAALRNGVLNADLGRLELYGGNIAGKVTLDGSGPTLGADVEMKIAGVKLGELARAAAGGEAPISGVASGTIAAQTSGASPRALVQGIKGRISFNLDRLDVKDVEAGQISEVALTLDLPGLDAGPMLRASAVYDKERVTFDLNLAALKKVLGGERFALKAALASKLVNASYEGSVQQQPVPGLAGDLSLDIPSVGKLAAWLGRPLPSEQPDPGPLTLRANFSAEGAKAVLNQANVEGKAVKATAQGSFDGGAEVPVLVARLNIEELDLNAYLPETKREAAAEPAPKAAEPSKGWSEEPFDLAPLGQVNADIAVRTGPVKYKSLVIERSRLTALLKNSLLEVKVEELVLAGGTINANLTLDGSKGKARLSYALAVNGVEAKPVLAALADFDRLSGKTEARAKGAAQGRNQKEIVQTLNGDGAFKFLDGAIEGINLAATLRKAKTLGIDEQAGERQKTDFAELGGTFTITNGVVDNRDFKMVAPLVRVAGAGVVPMPPRTVDYRVEAKLVASLQGQGGDNSLAGLPIPIKVTGSWDNPTYTVDWASVFKQAALDPKRLKNMPADLRDAAKGFGVPIAIPELTGAGGGVLKALPKLSGGGSGQTPSAGGATSEASGGGLGGLLKQVIPPSAPATTEETKESKPNPITKGLKSLFGGD